MILNKIDDPRDNLEKAHRMELVRFAHAQGATEITEHMPAILIRAHLRAKGLTNIRITPRPLGAQNVAPAPGPDQKVPTIDAAADLARQFAAQQPAPSRSKKPPRYQRLVERPKSEINKMRDYCKAHGIKMDRRDRKDDLKRKIEEHGSQNTAPSVQ